MKNINLATFFLFSCFFISSITNAQKLKEDFSQNTLTDWYVKNTSKPQPYEINNWSYNTRDACAIAEYSKLDYDGATISKWFITPMLYNLKNGDQIKFNTRARPDNDGLQNAINLLTLNSSGFDCNRPNRLEVRLNTHFSEKVYSDSINTGTTPSEVGHFDKLLLTINPDLTDVGYPQQWTTYTITISGLPTNQVLNGRIGFRYFFENGGYANCQSRLELPEIANAAIDLAIDKIGSKIKGLAPAKFIFDIIRTSSEKQVGKNGTYINLDDVEVSTKGLYIMDRNSWVLREKKYYWDAYNLTSAPYVKMGYSGSPDCNTSSNTLINEREFIIYNETSTAINIKLKTESIDKKNVIPLYLEYDEGITTIQPGESINVIAKLKKDIAVGEYYNKFWIESNGQNLGEVKMIINIESGKYPIAKCKTNNEAIKLTGDGGSINIDASIYNNESTNYCNSTSDLSFALLNKQGTKLNSFSCDNLGINEYLFQVTDNKTNLSSTSSIFIDVYNAYAPNIQSDFIQNYYLPKDYSLKTMPISAIIKPKIILGCSNSMLEIIKIKNLNNYDLGVPQELGFDSYTVDWKAIDKGGRIGYGSSILNVIDTIKPIANCKSDTINIGFIQSYKDWGLFIKTGIWGKIDFGTQSFDNTNTGYDQERSGIKKYLLSTSWKGYTNFRDEIPFTCADAGSKFLVTMKVIDGSGNFSTCQSYVKIAQPDIPKCKDIFVDLDSKTGTKIITANDLLLSGGDGVCGTKNSSVSKSTFTCADVNKSISVKVYYTDAANKEHTCTSKVTVNEYSSEGLCVDTIKTIIDPYELTTRITFKPVIESVCSKVVNLNVKTSGVSEYNVTQEGEQTLKFPPGIANVTRTTLYQGNNYTCKQVLLIVDNSKPIINSTPTNQNVDFTYDGTSFGGNSCTYGHIIENPFQEGSYIDWTYTLSGATSDTRTYVKSYVYYNEGEGFENAEWHKKAQLNEGITTITLKAKDYSGNESVLIYTVNVKLKVSINPYAVSKDITLFGNVLYKNVCSEFYALKIPKLNVSCSQKNYKWYYNIKESKNGNIIFSKENIPQDSGATILIKTSNLNNTITNFIELGYYNILYGNKEMTQEGSVIVYDSADVFNCPQNVTVQNTNNTTYQYSYLLNSPIANKCEGAFWGYSVTGATTISSAVNSTVLNQNQKNTLTTINSIDAYPSIVYNLNTTLALNIGVNVIKLSYMEASGNFSECTYTVIVKDISTPQMTCPSDITIHRSNTNSCDVTVGTPCQQIADFTGPYGISGIGLIGENSSIFLDKSAIPQSISFKTTKLKTNFANSYTIIKANCNGTISFNWEYKSASPWYFSPFINYNTYNPNLYSQPKISGFNSYLTGVQTGTYSQNVTKGQYIIIGVSNDGANDGYFKISNLSAPYSNPTATITPPSFLANSNIFLQSDVESIYGIGDHTINYKLINSNNNNQKTCTQKLKVIDDFATTLVCNNQNVYLNNDGYAVLNPKSVVSTCFPLSSTKLSKATYNLHDIGTQNVTLTSNTESGNTYTCNFNVTVLDTVKPIARTAKFNISLDYYNNGLLSDSLIRSLFYDNCGIKTVSANKTSFNCTDAGLNNITITGTDSSGNSKSTTLLVEVYPLGFNLYDADITQELCIGESKKLSITSGSINNPLSWQWQIKEKVDSLQQWNIANNLPPLSSNHKFVRLKLSQNQDNTYMAYTNGTSSDISFKVFNPISNTWQPIFKTLPRTCCGPFTNFTKSFNLGVNEIDHVPYVTYLDNTGAVKMFRFVIDQWQPVEENTLFYTINKDFNHLYFNDGYMFPVLYNGRVHVAKEYYSGTSQFWYVYNGPISYDTYITNAKNIVGIRNTTNKNYFYKMNLNPSTLAAGGAFLTANYGGKDSLTVDPTGNSAIFVLKSFKNEAFVAFKEANGKVSVKKFNGSNLWSNVGNLGLSTNEVFKIDLGVVNDTLYLAYIESGDKLFVKKWNGTTWVNNGKGSLSTSESIKIIDLAGKVYVYTNSGTLMVRDGWENISNATSDYRPNTSVAGDNQYRVITTKLGCTSQISGVKRIIVTNYPTISVSDTAINQGSEVKLKAVHNGNKINWISSLKTGENYLSNEDELIVSNIKKDSIVYAYASNNLCNSDTVEAHIYYNSVHLDDINVIFKDSVCSGEGTVVNVSNPKNEYQYLIYKQNEKGLYEINQGPSINSEINFYVSPSKETNYKVKAMDPITDAAKISSNTDYIDFGIQNLPITNTVTIEAWVKTWDNKPKNSLGHLFAEIDPQVKNCNWEWGDLFIVNYNSGSKMIKFPILPISSENQWVHVATTAGPTGLEIYYNGVLVASSSYTENDNITLNAKAKLTFGLLGLAAATPGEKAYAQYGLDEVRVWNTKRTANEIKTNFKTCLKGDETGLILFNNFNEYNATTKSFTSIVGTKSVVTNALDYYPYTTFRTGECYNRNINEIVSKPFTIKTLSNQSKLTYIDPSYYSESTVCGGDNVSLVAHASEGSIKWYNEAQGGTLVGFGDTLKMYIPKSTKLFAQPANSMCDRWEIDVSVNGTPEILYTINDTICSGTRLNDSYLDAITNEEARDFKWFDAPTGGNLVEFDGEGESGSPIVTKSDTLYAEAYNDLCISSTRTPAYITVVDPILISASNDTTLCVNGSITLKAKGIGEKYFWWKEDELGYSMVSNDSVYKTSNLSSTTKYWVSLFTSKNCYSKSKLITVNIVQDVQKYDTIAACEKYTWIDGNTYTYSDSNIVYTKHSAQACDTVFHLNLKINNIAYTEIHASKLGICNTNSTTIIIDKAQMSVNYKLYDHDNNAIISTQTGNGGNLIFQTGELTKTTTFGIIAEDTVKNGSKSKSCSLQIDAPITIKVGSKFSERIVSRCGSYVWNGITFTQSGIYKDTISSATCDSIIQLKLTILKPSALTQTVSACESYTWRGVTYTSSTTQTWSGFTAQGCDSTITLQLTINPKPTATFISDNNGSANAIAGADTYQWINCDKGNSIIANQTSSTFFPLESGLYAVKVSKNGCINTSACNQINSLITEVKTGLSKDEITIIPNPNNGKFVIDFGTKYKEIDKYTIKNMVGQTVKTDTNILSKTENIVFDEPSGVYLIEIDTNTGNKFILKYIKN